MLPIAQNLMCSVVAGGAGDTAAGMRAGSAEIQAADGSSILRPSRHWTHEEHLLQAEIAVKNIALGQSVGSLEIQRGKDLSREDRVRHVGRVLGNSVRDAVAQQFAVFVPCALPQSVRNILHEASEDVLAGR